MKTLRIWLTISVAFNLLGVVLVAYVIHKKGMGDILYKLSPKFAVAQAASRQYTLSIFNAYPELPNAVVFAGDSITAMNDWQKAFPKQNVYNEGIGGDTSDGLLARVNAITRLHPSKVFIMIGVNDLLFANETPQHVIENDRKLVSEIRKASPNTEICFESVLPINTEKFAYESSVVAHGNSLINELNKELKSFAESVDATYVDLYPDFVVDNQLNPNWTIDGLHFDASGYKVMQRDIAPYLN